MAYPKLGEPLPEMEQVKDPTDDGLAQEKVFEEADDPAQEKVLRRPMIRLPEFL